MSSSPPKQSLTTPTKPINSTTTTTTTAPTAAAPAQTSTPIWTRKRDLLYLVFFLVHIPTILCTSPLSFSPFAWVSSSFISASHCVCPLLYNVYPAPWAYIHSSPFLPASLPPLPNPPTPTPQSQPSTLIPPPPQLVVDLYAIYPPHLQLPFMTSLRTYYISTYKDQFSISPPAWFTTYMWMEALYHLPLSVWAIGGLVRGKSLLLFLPLLFPTSTSSQTYIKKIKKKGFRFLPPNHTSKNPPKKSEIL